MSPLLTPGKYELSNQAGTTILTQLAWIPQAVYAAMYPPEIEDTLQTSYTITYNKLIAGLLSKAGNHPKVMLITSTCRDKTPSWITMNIVYFLAKAGQKVLLADGDFHSPTVHQAFDLEYDDAFSFYNLLQQKSPLRLEQLYASPDIPDLWLLPNTTSDESITPDFSSLAEKLESLKSAFDWIILDTAPVMENEETKTLLSYIDEVLLIEDYQSSAEHMHIVAQYLILNEIPITAKIQRREGHFFKLPVVVNDAIEQLI